MSKKITKNFVFIDETGDTGVKENSSKYFKILLLVTNNIGLEIIESMISDLRFFKNYNKELKKLNINKEKELFLKIYERLKIGGVEFYFLSINKEKYIGPYLKKINITEEDLNPHTFTNFLIKKALRHITKNSKTISNGKPVEVIIDRYLYDEDHELNLKRYLNDGYNIIKFDSIELVDSRYCTPIQLLDHIKNFINKPFVEEVPIDTLEKKKGPDIPIGPGT